MAQSLTLRSTTDYTVEQSFAVVLKYFTLGWSLLQHTGTYKKTLAE